METAIGVFTARDHAEEAVKELRQRGLPEEALIFLTRSEGEAKTIGKEFGAYVGGFVGGAAGMTTGVVTAALLLPGVGTVFALGFGAALTRSPHSRAGRVGRALQVGIRTTRPCRALNIRPRQS